MGTVIILFIQLSEELKNINKESNVFCKDKISISGKSISSIGYGLNECFLNITKLFLSNNKISSLDGIEIFKNLTHFSISYNKIVKISELKKINNKHKLTSISVKGNFFCINPNTNTELICLFPNLQDLDGYKIKESTSDVIQGTLLYKFRWKKLKI
jgi:hypothetical protein